MSYTTSARAGRGVSWVVLVPAVAGLALGLGACGKKSATKTGASASARATSGPGQPSPAPSNSRRSPSPKVAKNVKAGAFCSTVGQKGTTSAGKTLTCTKQAGDSRARWR